YYVMPCRLFDRHTRSCTVHGTELQPKTCSAYNEHDCWYQRATRDDAAGFLRFDRARFTRLLDVLTFDQDRNLATAPNWGEMVEMCRATPLACTWESVLASEGEMLPQTLPLQQAAPSETRTLAEWLKDPCTRCDAPCCRYLLFPLPIPRTFMQLDYVRFCLGFPGIEVLATPAAWSLLLRADCTHLDAKSLRCTVFDRPERPLHCRHLNQWQCDPYRQLLQTGAPLQRLDYGAFVEISAQARFDDSGTIVEWPGLPAGD
ncbi:MAG: YkgJ family cysteine cluster protein, partial [Anaerolineae bacterium]